MSVEKALALLALVRLELLEASPMPPPVAGTAAVNISLFWLAVSQASSKG